MKARDLLPQQDIADTVDVSDPLIVSSQEDFGVESIGPVLPDTSWQAVANQGSDLPHFQID